MKNKDIMFEEIEHWLRFIQLWEQEHEQPVPEQALLSLENALDKAMTFYWQERTSIRLNRSRHKLVH